MNRKRSGRQLAKKPFCGVFSYTMKYFCKEINCKFSCEDTLAFSQHMLSHNTYCHVCDISISHSKNWTRHLQTASHVDNMRHLHDDNASPGILYLILKGGSGR